MVRKLAETEGASNFLDSVASLLTTLESKWAEARSDFALALETAAAAERQDDMNVTPDDGSAPGTSSTTATAAAAAAAGPDAGHNWALEYEENEKVRTTRSRSAPASQTEKRTAEEGWDALPPSCQAFLKDPTMNIDTLIGESQQAKEAAAAASIPVAAACTSLSWD